jgi:hypothetical protein
MAVINMWETAQAGSASLLISDTDQANDYKLDDRTRALAMAVPA